MRVATLLFLIVLLLSCGTKKAEYNTFSFSTMSPLWSDSVCDVKLDIAYSCGNIYAMSFRKGRTVLRDSVIYCCGKRYIISNSIFATKVEEGTIFKIATIISDTATAFIFRVSGVESKLVCKEKSINDTTIRICYPTQKLCMTGVSKESLYAVDSELEAVTYYPDATILQFHYTKGVLYYMKIEDNVTWKVPPPSYSTDSINFGFIYLDIDKLNINEIVPAALKSGIRNW